MLVERVGAVLQRVPLREDVAPGARTHVTFTLRVPDGRGAVRVLLAREGGTATEIGRASAAEEAR